MIEAEMLLQVLHAALQVADRQLHLGHHAGHLLQPERLVLQLRGNARAPVKLLHALLQLTQPRHKTPQVNLNNKEENNQRQCYGSRSGSARIRNYLVSKDPDLKLLILDPDPLLFSSIT